MIRQILIALCIGCMATFWFMQKDERVKHYIGTQFKKTFQKAIGCTFEGAVESVSFFSPRITFSNVHVDAKDAPGWLWTAQRFTVSCSWWYLIMYRSVDLRVILESLEVQSDIIDGKAAVAGHMQKIFMGLKVGLPIELKSVTFKRGTCCLRDAKSQMNARFVWQSELKKMEGRLKISGYLLDGSLQVTDRVMFEQLKGSLHADIGTPADPDASFSIDCSTDLPYLPQGMRQTFIAGSWKGTHGTFALKNVHEQVVIDPIQLFYDGVRGRCSIRGSVPLSSMWRFAQNDSLKDEVAGVCSLLCDMRYEDDDCAVTGRVSVDDCRYKEHQLGAAVATFARQQGNWKGSITANQDAGYGLKGSWQWQETTCTGSLNLANTDTIQLPEFLRLCIKPGLFQCNVAMNAAGRVTGTYKTTIDSLWHDTTLECAGIIESDGKQIVSTGTIQHNPYHCAVQLNPSIQLISCTYDDQMGTPLVRVSGDLVDESIMHAVIGLPFIRKLSEETYNTFPLQMEGSVAASLKKKSGILDVSITTVDALVRLPQTYNVVRDLTCGIQIDTHAETITIQDLVCQFHEGRVVIKRAIVHYDEHHAPIFMHVPVVVDELMLNMEQGLLAKVSGYALLTKRPDTPTDIAGSVIIDRAYLKENLLSGTFHKNLFRYTGRPFASYHADTTCDIQISSRVPVKVKTPFLETAVRVNVHVKNTFKDPVVTGSIDLLSGFLAFPYRPLYITKGTIYFLPHQLHDPSIELIAKNKIKKYNVELHVSGSLENHQIALDATPALTEEQTIALLLVGSEEESLNVVMPALIMQNLQTIMFGYDQSSRSIDKMFTSLLKPFSHIHVVPSFSDKTGRGGLRGAIEIDVNDRWRALIQKNFSLTEDTRLEVEYQVSDEISVRGVANERHDVGAEVEMRWKF